MHTAPSIQLHSDHSSSFRKFIRITERNNITYQQICVNYISARLILGKPMVVFCTSVNHAKELEELFNKRGVKAHAVSGSTKPAERKNILKKYDMGEIPVLCACDLLNEGWDSPHTQVLFMARPTMSKTIYMQQLGRGMRISEGKDFLMVFDFVDNANMFNCPYSMHRLFNVSEYWPGGLVLGKKHGVQWNNDMFAKGEKPEMLLDYPVHAQDYEIIELFNWQDRAKDMISQYELTRRVSAQSETIERYIRDGLIKPDLEVPIGDHRSFKYFLPERRNLLNSMDGSLLHLQT